MRPPTRKSTTLPPSEQRTVRIEPLKAALRRLRIGSLVLRARRALRFGLRIEAGALIARLRWLKRPGLTPLSGDSGTVECFMLLNEPRIWEGIWSLHSFRRVFGPCRLTVLNDGSLSADSIALLERLFPGIRIPDVARNDAWIDAQLAERGLERCRDWRRRFVFFRKLIDPVLLARSDAIVLLDSDILHFREPEAVKAWAEHPDRLLFIADVQAESYFAPIARLHEICGAPPPGYFCAGYLGVPRGDIDLARIERHLADPLFEDQRRSGRFEHVAEQTLYGMEAAVVGATMLPAGYATCPDPSTPEVVMGHFCGGQPSRYWLYTKGLPFLDRKLKAVA